MRLILVNPHTFAYAKLVSGFIFRRKMLLKYDFFTQFYIHDKQKKIAFYIDGTRSSFGITFPFFSKTFAFLELLVWMGINGVNPARVRVYFDISKLNPHSDIIFDFSRALVDVNEKTLRRLQLNQFQGIVLIHFTHYFQNVRKISEYIKTIPYCVVVAEGDLVTNRFFNQFFGFVREVYQLPYSINERFVLGRKDFHTKMNKCMALGTLCPVEDTDFFNFFGKETALHPMRRIIYDEHHKFPDEIDSLMKEFQDVKIIKHINKGDSFILKLIKKILPCMILERIIPIPQKEYFKFDIVKKYNAYKMFVCPEEIIGLPSINVFEGMACKCVYVGIDDPMFGNIGMLPGIHYVAYRENDLEDLVSKIRYYQSHPDELEKIAEQGYHFARNHFNRKNISEVFWNDLEKMSDYFSERKAVAITCSFKRN